MTNFKLAAVALTAAMLATSPAKAFCWLTCEPTEAEARKVFENVVKQKFATDARIEKFEMTRFWRIDVEGSTNKSVEFYFTALVEFPKGANLDCKPEVVAGAQTVKAGCSTSQYFSTTIQNQMIKERQYIEPGAKIEFKDETRLDHLAQGWKGQDGNYY